VLNDPRMAEPLKIFFDRALVERIASSLTAAYPDFPRARFVRASRGLDALELKARAQQIADALASSLPSDFPEAARVVVRSLGPKHATDELEGAGMAPFFYLPHTMWVAGAGLEHFEEAMDAQVELTQRFTCEFSIRSFLERYPERTIARMTEWARDPNPHVRRLVSEGTRSRLPWASRVRWLDEHPERVLPVLELLKDDPSSMVRRSVANHLNDLGKHRPDLVLPLAARWLEGASEERRKLVEHALRSAVKRGEKGALALLGHGARPALSARATATPKRVPVGGKVKIVVTVESTSRAAQSLNLDLEVAFVKVRGTGPKVFKLGRIELAPGASATLEKTVSLAVHSTRTPRPGRHEVALLANGERFPVTAFTVTAP
jgi:3-methyladenine DNA glycosylase AlkC